MVDRTFTDCYGLVGYQRKISGLLDLNGRMVSVTGKLLRALKPGHHSHDLVEQLELDLLDSQSTLRSMRIKTKGE